MSSAESCGRLLSNGKHNSVTAGDPLRSLEPAGLDRRAALPLAEQTSTDVAVTGVGVKQPNVTKRRANRQPCIRGGTNIAAERDQPRKARNAERPVRGRGQRCCVGILGGSSV